MLIKLVLTEIQLFKNVKINKEMYGHPEAVFGQHPDGHTFFCKFWHFQMAVGSIYTKLKDFVIYDHVDQ